MCGVCPGGEAAGAGLKPAPSGNPSTTPRVLVLRAADRREGVEALSPVLAHSTVTGAASDSLTVCPLVQLGADPQ